MIHDPLCPQPLCDYNETADAECIGYGDCTHRCQCALIAKVRNETLAQAIAVVRGVRTFDDSVYESQVVMHLDVLSALRALQEPS